MVQRGTYPNKKRISFEKNLPLPHKASHQRTGNKFSALADKEDKTTPTPIPQKGSSSKEEEDESGGSNAGHAGSVKPSQSNSKKKHHNGDDKKEDIEMGSKTGAEEGQEEGDTPHTVEPPPTPKEIRITTNTPDWVDDESVGEAACSGDEKSPPKKNLQDIIPPALVTTDYSTTACSSLSHSTNPSAMIDPSSGQNLITVEIQIQPEKDNFEVMIAETKNLLS